MHTVDSYKYVIDLYNNVIIDKKNIQGSILETFASQNSEFIYLDIMIF